MRTPLALGLAALGLLALAPGARAQNAVGFPAGPRVLHEITDDVKLDDGSSARWHFVTVYDPASGETTQTVTDATTGALIRRESGLGGMAVPGRGEVEMATAIIQRDPELASIIAAAPNALVTGGFTLRREEGHPCGPGGRCLQFDIVNVNESARQVERLRYVIVDLRNGTVFDRDFDPATEGNLSNPLEPRVANY